MNIIETAALINQKAMVLYCHDDIEYLEPVEKVRFIQIREGNKSCFGRDEPLEPLRNEPSLCAILECCWKPSCDYLRLATEPGPVSGMARGDWDPGMLSGGGELY